MNSTIFLVGTDNSLTEMHSSSFETEAVFGSSLLTIPHCYGCRTVPTANCFLSPRNSGLPRRAGRQ